MMKPVAVSAVLVLGILLVAVPGCPGGGDGGGAGGSGGATSPLGGSTGNGGALGTGGTSSVGACEPCVHSKRCCIAVLGAANCTDDLLNQCLTFPEPNRPTVITGCTTFLSLYPDVAECKTSGVAGGPDASAGGTGGTVVQDAGTGSGGSCTTGSGAPGSAGGNGSALGATFAGAALSFPDVVAVASTNAAQRVNYFITASSSPNACTQATLTLRLDVAPQTTSGTFDCGGVLSPPLSFQYMTSTGAATDSYSTGQQAADCTGTFSSIPPLATGGHLIGTFSGSMTKTFGSGAASLAVTNGTMDVIVPPSN